jgi:hypothetical protein
MTKTIACNGRNFYTEIVLPRSYLRGEVPFADVVHLEDNEYERKKDLEYMKKEYRDCMVWQEEK